MKQFVKFELNGERVLTTLKGAVNSIENYEKSQVTEKLMFLETKLNRITVDDIDGLWGVFYEYRAFVKEMMNELTNDQLAKIAKSYLRIED